MRALVLSLSVILPLSALLSSGALADEHGQCWLSKDKVWVLCNSEQAMHELNLQVDAYVGGAVDEHNRQIREQNQRIADRNAAIEQQRQAQADAQRHQEVAEMDRYAAQHPLTTGAKVCSHVDANGTRVYEDCRTRK